MSQATLHKIGEFDDKLNLKFPKRIELFARVLISAKLFEEITSPSNNILDE